MWFLNQFSCLTSPARAATPSDLLANAPALATDPRRLTDLLAQAEAMLDAGKHLPARRPGPLVLWERFGPWPSPNRWGYHPLALR